MIKSPLYFFLFLISLGKTQHVFPDDFEFGVATSAYQIEGGWNADGKAPSVWDRNSHISPSIIVDGSTGDIACNSYQKWKEDVANIKYLGVNFYRFSIAWTRIFPEGSVNKINQAGVDYYNNLIDELLENGIEPMITLYHWDTPMIFVPLGELSNRNFVQAFADYAKKAFELFGDRVKTWITFNEPKVVCVDFLAYLGSVSPNYPSGRIEYLCSHHIILAHAKAYQIYDREFRLNNEGKIGIALSLEWPEAETDSLEDIEAAEQRRAFEFGLYANPILNYDYPQIVKDRVAQRSALENYPQSRLPEFSSQEKSMIHGSYDFLGFNQYSSWLVKASEEHPIGKSSVEADTGTIARQPSEWIETGFPHMKVAPWGLRKALQWLKETYRNPLIYITENGYPDNDGAVEDDKRISYYQDYLKALLEAIHEDGVNVKGYTAWSLMDNFEWSSGYTVKFGLYQVDFDSPDRTRIIKKSGEYYKNIIASRKVPE